jgi:hypothetical protein
LPTNFPGAKFAAYPPWIYCLKEDKKQD